MATSAAPAQPSSTASMFSSLIERSRKLREETETAALPPIQLSLGEIERRAAELKRTTEGDRDVDARARYLLGSGGINTDETLRELEQIDFQTGFEPTGPLNTDLNAYLRSRKDQSISASIEEGMRAAARDFDSFVAQNVTMEWESQRQRIYEHFGLASKGTAGPDTSAYGSNAFGTSAFGRSRLGESTKSAVHTNSVWTRSSMGGSVMGPPRADTYAGLRSGNLFADVDSSRQLESTPHIQARREQYGRAVTRMNEVRQSGGTFPVMNTFAGIADASGNDRLSLQLHDCYKLLASIAGEVESAENDPFGVPKERKYVNDYILNTLPDSPQAGRIRQRVESGSRKFLEKQFEQVVDRTVRDNPAIARVGGVPSTFNKFRGFINVKMSTNKDLPEWDPKNFEVLEDIPCWAMIFYLLRAGFVREADEYVRSQQQSFQKLDRGFATYLHAYASSEERRLPKNLHDRIQGEYTNRVRHMEDSKDPFKPAVYKVIGRCELAKRSVPTVMPTAEDWMWLQLVLSREIDRTTEPAHEVFTLADLQKSIVQFGAKHFLAKGSNFGLYLQMLLMCGLFEEAVQYLYSFDAVDGVHFAIALTYYGLLRPTSESPTTTAELLTLGPRGEKQINFPRLLGYYTRDYRTLNIEEAVDYLTLICLNGDLPPPAGPRHLSTCHEALRELVLTTKEFTRILGDVKRDGTRLEGAIEKRARLINLADQPDFLRTVIEQAAIQADQDGRASDAVMLYHLAGDYDTVVQILTKNLSDHIALETATNIVPSPYATAADASLAGEDNPQQLARDMMSMYSSNAAVLQSISLRNREACGVLQEIATAKNFYEQGNWEFCLQLIDRVDVIPLDPRGDVSAIRRRAQNFGLLHEAVARNVGALLKMAVECCARLAQQLRESAFADANKAQLLAELKARTKSAMIYAGLIQYKLPADVYTFLNSREMAD